LELFWLRFAGSGLNPRAVRCQYFTRRKATR